MSQEKDALDKGMEKLLDGLDIPPEARHSEAARLLNEYEQEERSTIQQINERLMAELNKVPVGKALEDSRLLNGEFDPDTAKPLHSVRWLVNQGEKSKGGFEEKVGVTVKRVYE